MFELGKEFLQSITDALSWIPQPAVEGPNIHYACNGCTGACKNNCVSGCKGSCKNTCTRSCKGHSR